jgi:hypothetical protein
MAGKIKAALAALTETLWAVSVGAISGVPKG